MKFSTSLLAVSGLATLVSAAWDLGTVNNIVTYWGQNAGGQADSQLRLAEYCAVTDYDMIIIGFVNSWAVDGTNVTINVSNACEGWRRFPDSDMLWCPTIRDDIKICQQTYGKKILMSIGGGALAYDAVHSKNAGYRLAENIWNMIGKGWTYERPFGDAVVDGFDFDIEGDSSFGNQYYDQVAYRLKQLMDQDKAFSKKPWILTASPQCPLPDEKMDKMMRAVAFDAAFIQYYNNPGCAATTWVKNKVQTGAGSAFNFGAWDAWAKASSKNKNIKLFMTLPLSSGAGVGYVSRTVAQNIINDIKKYTSFAGFAAWDASVAKANTGYVSAIRTTLNNIQAAKAKRWLTGSEEVAKNVVEAQIEAREEHILLEKKNFISRHMERKRSF